MKMVNDRHKDEPMRLDEVRRSPMHLSSSTLKLQKKEEQTNRQKHIDRL